MCALRRKTLILAAIEAAAAQTSLPYHAAYIPYSVQLPYPLFRLIPGPSPPYLSFRSSLTFPRVFPNPAPPRCISSAVSLRLELQFVSSSLSHLQ
ncbi:Hypothetical protein NTJ_13976 [Nesidiocoris tenuis]|uniref:Secreted protein n=1 Tax=Nesidiocoris tenuis TaxID=355587 RepID=A0ABN7BBX0_9HEMI|nr:Hypothetical protein NTJ_13976 [Nesidiocoris tenuis]